MDKDFRPLPGSMGAPLSISTDTRGEVAGQGHYNPGPEMNKTWVKGPLEDEIRAKCAQIADFLVEKNRAYGSSVEKPVQVFATGVDRLTLVKVRMDDKLSRLARGNALPEESLRDTRRDLVGYLILLEVLEELSEKSSGKHDQGG